MISEHTTVFKATLVSWTKTYE